MQSKLHEYKYVYLCFRKPRLVYIGFLLTFVLRKKSKNNLNFQIVHTYMQQNANNQVHQWLAKIDPCQLELAKDSTEEGYQQELNQITEKVRTWAMAVLEKANLPSAPHEAKALLEKYNASTREGCALHAVIELDAMHASIHNTDANTAAITGMKLFEAIWQHTVTKIHQTNSQITAQGNVSKKDLLPARQDESEKNIKLYQDTINELKKKYPHCNVNALRLLASTRLNVTKQQLDDLGISPQ